MQEREAVVEAAELVLRGCSWTSWRLSGEAVVEEGELCLRVGESSGGVFVGSLLHKHLLRQNGVVPPYLPTVELLPFPPRPWSSCLSALSSTRKRGFVETAVEYPIFSSFP